MGRRFMVMSGFLGAGKTTSMLAIAEELAKRGVKAAIISNDLGSSELVDELYTAERAACSGAIADGCICYQTEVLAGRIKQFSDADGAGLVMSDIPGCGVGALEHVYFKLAREYPGEFELAPFTAVCDPMRLRAIMPEHANLHLPEEINYLFRTQLLEADAIILNKTDTVSAAEQARYADFLSGAYPGIPVFPISAKTGAGIGPLADHLMSASARLVQVDTGYGGPEFTAAEARLSWYDQRFYVKKAAAFDGCGFMGDFMEAVAARLRRSGGNVPHLKVFAAGGCGDFAKASLVGIDSAVEFDARLGRRYPAYRMVVNARAACDSLALSALMDEALSETAEKYGVQCRILPAGSFGASGE
jgi:Ni2+-binding GTPase involved in maturation of urease and hydrogenase